MSKPSTVSHIRKGMDLVKVRAVDESGVLDVTFFNQTAIDSFRGDCQLRVWLCQIARNQYLTLCRERQKFADTVAEPGDNGIEAGFADREDARRLHVLLHCLTDFPVG